MHKLYEDFYLFFFPRSDDDDVFLGLVWQQLIAELVATYFLLFGGNAVVIVNINSDKVISFPGVAITWGLLVMVMIYATGHISGAHFNPAVTIAFASIKRFPWIHVLKNSSTLFFIYVSLLNSEPKFYYFLLRCHFM